MVFGDPRQFGVHGKPMEIDLIASPSFYHPTTVVVVDDDEDFVEALKLGINADIPFKGFSDPRQARHYIDNCPRIDRKPDLPPWYDPARFQAAGVIVIDYRMPVMSGFELCDDLSGHPSKRVLLSGVATAYEAIDGFNRDLYSKYIVKGQIESLDILQDSVGELNRRLFAEYFPVARGHAFMLDIGFVDWLFDFMPKQGYVEYYSDDDGLLLIDKNGQQSYMEVCAFDDYVVQKNLLNDIGIPAWVTDKLKDTGLVLGNLNDRDLDSMQDDDWHNCLCRGGEVIGRRQAYRFAILPSLPSGYNGHTLNTLAQHLAANPV